MMPSLPGQCVSTLPRVDARIRLEMLDSASKSFASMFAVD